jgi:Ca2+-binding EF-hand superfamily protein
MRKAIIAVVGSALLGLGLTAVADDAMMNHEHMTTMFRTMDTNGDGKISKEEYMAYYEKMWMSMKKDSNGMVDEKSMMMSHDAMMKSNGMSKDGTSH